MTSIQLENVVLAYYDDIYRYFVCRLRDRTTAEDLTQETFFRFIRYAAGKTAFANGRKCKSYLFTVASNVCRDHFNSFVTMEELDENIPAAQEERDLSLVLEDALAKLPDPQREAAMLFYYHGFRVHEIAVIQGVTQSAVKSRLKAARDTLRKLLEYVPDEKEGKK